MVKFTEYSRIIFKRKMGRSWMS